MAFTREQVAAKIQQLLVQMWQVHQEAMTKLAGLRTRQRDFYQGLNQRWDQEALKRTTDQINSNDPKGSQDK